MEEVLSARNLCEDDRHLMGHLEGKAGQIHENVFQSACAACGFIERFLNELELLDELG